MESNRKGLVLVTGATGYISGHMIRVLLEANYRVRGTVRKVADKSKYEYLLKLPGVSAETLEFVEADLLKPDSWESACVGCDYVMHLASPFVIKAPKNEDELIKPAVEGTLSVLNAALKAGVKKVVVTSSIAAVATGYGKEADSKTFNESDWSIIANCPAYQKSKTLAEKAVWEFHEQNKSKIQIAVINPGFVVGPSDSVNSFASADLILSIMNNSVPGFPRICMSLVDVRDVAKAHLLALENPNSDGKRYILTGTCLWFQEIIQILKEEFGPLGYKFPTRTIGTWLLTIGSWFDRSLKDLLPIVGIPLKVDNSLSKQELGMQYIDAKQSLIDMGHSLINNGLVKQKQCKPKK